MAGKKRTAKKSAKKTKAKKSRRKKPQTGMTRVEACRVICRSKWTKVSSKRGKSKKR